MNIADEIWGIYDIMIEKKWVCELLLWSLRERERERESVAKPDGIACDFDASFFFFLFFIDSLLQLSSNFPLLSFLH